MNKKLKESIEAILGQPRPKPIIILQGDHGPSSGFDTSLSNPDETNLPEKMSILNAYYLPDNGAAELYDAITPVNTFRIIFNEYLGTRYSLLPDKSYFSTWEEPYKFIQVDSIIDAVENRGQDDVAVSGRCPLRTRISKTLGDNQPLVGYNGC